MTQQRRTPADDSLEPDDLFHSIRTRIAQRDKATAGAPISVDLLPLPPETPATGPVSALARLSSGFVLRGRYVIESQVGSGGMGTVYKALDRSRSEHTEIDARVAIKILHEQTRSRAEVVSKLRREFYSAQILAHPNVVKVYELDLDRDFSFFTMELIDGESLFRVMKKLHPLPLPRDYVWTVIRETGAGVAHAHDRRVIHGDLKPQNVMVTNNGELRILDFGTSRHSATTLTPAYASCEMLEGREPDPRDDLFALACLSYELLAGEHPFQQRRSTEARSLKMTPPRPPGLSGRQWKALTAALSWDRADRPRSVRDWLSNLDLGSEPLGAVPEPKDPKPLPLVKGHVTSGLIALAAAVLICCITWAVLSRPKARSLGVEADTSAPLNVERALAAAENEESQTPAEAAPVPAKAAVKTRVPGALTAARPMDKTEKIGVVSDSYSVGRGEKFTEIRVHRYSGSKAGTSFDWWTEPGTAVAGTDYAPQAPATISFPAGVHTVSLFIKLIPNASRKRTDVFYVVLGNPSPGAALGAVSKAAVSVHP
jgi:serine/threonine protein kinase